MAEYGPLTPSNRLEWFLMNGGSGGSGGGGGDTGDFTTAKFTVTAGTQESVDIYAPVVFTDDSDPTSFPVATAHGGAPAQTYNVILYKGSAVIYAPNGEISIESGSITDDGDGYYIITGDCEITVNGVARKE